MGYQPQKLRDVKFRHFMLQDLDIDQITEFVDRWHEETFDSEEQAAPKRDRLKKAIHDSKSIAMFAGNPLLLTMMAILNRNQELPAIGQIYMPRRLGFYFTSGTPNGRGGLPRAAPMSAHERRQKSSVASLPTCRPDRAA